MTNGATVESALVLAAQSDQSAFVELYHRYGERIYNFVLRSVRDPHGAEDVCQEIWIKVYRELGKLREPAAFSTWLYRVASRVCVDRARRRASSELAAIPDDLPDRDGDRPEDAALRREDMRLVWEALASLPVRQHHALFLREVEGRSYREIAKILETSESAIETLLFRARSNIANAYARLEGAMSERCGQARKSMAVLVDGEATPVQQNAVAAHVDGCGGCRAQLGRMRGAAAVYAALPLLPLPVLLGGKILHGVGSASASSGGGLIAKALAVATTKAKLTTAALTITGGIAVSAMVVPADHVTPGAGGPSLVSGSTLSGASDDAAAGAVRSDGPPASVEQMERLSRTLRALSDAPLLDALFEQLADRVETVGAGAGLSLDGALDAAQQAGGGVVDDAGRSLGPVSGALDSLTTPLPAVAPALPTVPPLPATAPALPTAEPPGLSLPTVPGDLPPPPALSPLP